MNLTTLTALNRRLAVLFVLAAAPLYLQAQTHPISKSLIQLNKALAKLQPQLIKLNLTDLEGVMLPEIYYLSWEGQNRTEWLGKVETAQTPYELACLVVNLETNISWDGVDESWRNRRESWLQDCWASTTFAEVAHYFAEFETYILLEATKPTWAAQRVAWRERMAVVK